jgi:hypothetical protein
MRFRWPLAGLAALVTILVCVLVIPQWLVSWELGAQVQNLNPAEKAKAINDVRATVLQAIGGVAILLGAYFTYRQLQTGQEQLEVTRQQAQDAAEQAREQLSIAQQGQVTDRFTRAIDQLGHAELDVRLGGIYALERIANDSPSDRTAIAEVLTAFIRSHAPWPPSLSGQYVADAPVERMTALPVRAPDVHAALTVLGRRQPLPESTVLELYVTDLRRSLLFDANFQEANLMLARLQGSALNGANLQGASLHDAKLHGANLDRANLQGAYLYGTNLQETSLDNTNLQDARADPQTLWPEGFDPRRAGVLLSNREADKVGDPRSQ